MIDFEKFWNRVNLDELENNILKLGFKVSVKLMRKIE